MNPPANLNSINPRLPSVDVFRAVTMLLMLFINDLSGVKGIPQWMDHAKKMDDSMGFADTIFPAFLFIVGLSIPLSIGKKIKEGIPFKSIAISVIARSFALIVMGFFHVNLEEYGSSSILPEAIWEILITVSFFLIWLDYAKNTSIFIKYSLIGFGWFLLILMAFLYNGGGSGHDGMETSWWGILGIIGWSYLVCAMIYLLCKGRFAALVVVLILFAAINITEHGTALHMHLPLINDASSITLVMAGVVISLWYSKLRTINNKHSMWLIFTAAGCLAIIVGLLIRPYTQGISKIRSTPAWVFICTGISILVFELFIYLVDVKGKQNWFKIILPAGTVTLTCYLIPYLFVGVFKLTHFNYPDLLNKGSGGFFRSVAFAFAVVLIAGLLSKKRIRLKI